MRLLSASVTRASSDILYSHLSSVIKQRLEKDIEVDYLYVLDPEISKESVDTLSFLGIPTVQGDPKSPGAAYEVGEFTHKWEVDTFHWLGHQKQKLIEFASAQKYDAIFLCDSDLVLSPDTLQSLIDSNKPIVSGNFWTKWTPQSPPLPQCWQEHPYEFQGRGVEAHEHLEALASRQLFKVGGLGACTLIRSSAFGKANYWPPLASVPKGGMWEGEDRVFCITAQRQHIPLFADGWGDIFHVYRPSDVGGIPKALERFQGCALKRSPSHGDLVSAILTPIEMNSQGEREALAGFEYHLRGRLGSMKIIPSLEEALTTMLPKEERFVKCHFPPWYEIPEFRNQTRTLRVKLLSVKPFAQPLGMDAPLANVMENLYES